MPPKANPTTDPFATGDTGPSTQPGDPDDPQVNADSNTPPDTPDTPGDDTRERAPYEPTPDSEWDDFDEYETRARYLERGDRADLLKLLDYRTR